MAMTPAYSDGNKGWKKGKPYEQWVKAQWPNVYKYRTLTFMEGKRAQLAGETVEGIEVKFDDRMKETGNVYIETEEKALKENENYVISGIYREDNSRLYLVGDYDRWFLFSKKDLQALDRLDPPFIRRPPPTGTSIGFCIPIKNAKHLCMDYQEFSNANVQQLNTECDLDNENWAQNIPVEGSYMAEMRRREAG